MTEIIKRTRQPIADKVVKRIEREIKSKIIDLSVIRASRKNVADLQATVASDEALVQLPPCLALYTLVQNQLGVISEILTSLPLMHRFYDQLEKAEEMYQPQGPPMSPLTPSFYTNWAQNDIGIGLGRETLTSVSIAVARKTGMHANFIELAQKIDTSRCGVYEHLGTDGENIQLRELWTNTEIRALNATGYCGQKGELWYTRLLPPNFLLPGIHVNFNTPYVMHPDTTKAHWLESIERALDKAKGRSPEQAFYHYMKHGPHPFYWTEYVFEAYVNFTKELIWLQGLPDRPDTRPHSPLYANT